MSDDRKSGADWVDDDVKQLIAATCSTLGDMRRVWLIARAAVAISYVKTAALVDMYVNFFSFDGEDMSENPEEAPGIN